VVWCQAEISGRGRKVVAIIMKMAALGVRFKLSSEALYLIDTGAK
jgi:hypothetical protein